MTKKALYLAGGGARGAYQAGALKAINTILGCKTLPFSVISGVSVGSINAAILAENAHDFPAGVAKLEHLWQEIRCEQIFNATNYALSKSMLRNILPILTRRQSGYLLSTEPLQDFIRINIDFEAIENNIINQQLQALEIISACYELRQTISFYQHSNIFFEDWHYPRHVSQRTVLNASHILASSALPLFFPAVHMNEFTGEFFFKE